ncbi:hypothetical protein GOP47_0015482 [Adiantum capillus-veneris]|uniref:assimilatory sulfite reductase (ferredoxin) n=1 Tax=Adiantum capillus-veneris TaxID=13818 RepID=A0A9D4UKP7_ADICA|nr:hypothetical protein GOP47_0015482 [Adiantum capillus-veneris]
MSYIVFGQGEKMEISGAVNFTAFEGLKGIKSSQATPSLEYKRQNQLSSFSRVKAVAAPVKPPNSLPVKRSKVEIIKEQSNYLRFPLKEELETEAPNINEAAVQLIKFHGSYQQDNREDRVGGKAYQFMLRTKQPSGKVSNKLYLVMDELADQFGIRTLRLTTRQTFQLHGVLKHNLKTVMSTIIKSMGSTLGACGDLNRNVMAPAFPFTRKDYLFAQETADKIAALLAPKAGSYYDMWVDGEKIMSADPPDVIEVLNDNSRDINFEDSPEPLYGTQFLPRKFKVAVTVPRDNSVDLLTNDVGLVVISDDDGEPKGFNIYVGGGMGRTHRMEHTFPRLAEPMGYVAKEDILYVVKAIVATQRDYGRRDDRRMSRMKYLVHEWGIGKFRAIVEQYYGKQLQPFQELPPWEFKSYLGWHEQGNGLHFCGIHIDNGRVKDVAKRTLREVIEKYKLNIRLTPNQNLILCDVRPGWKQEISRSLRQGGLLHPRWVDTLNLTSMACPALPLCPLAITEAERGAPDILRRIRKMFENVGLKASDTLVVRFTGCPNGCARPYMAELGFVGDGPNSYQIWLGGASNQSRLAQTFMEKVKLQDFEKVLTPLFHAWKTQRFTGESFGEFSMRVGFEELQHHIADWTETEKTVESRTYVQLEKDLYLDIRKLAEHKRTSVKRLVSEALKTYVESYTTDDKQ